MRLFVAYRTCSISSTIFYVSVSVQFVCSSVRSPVRPSARPSVRPSARPSVRPSVVRPSVRPFVCLPVDKLVALLISQYDNLSVCWSVDRSICRSIALSVLKSVDTRRNFDGEGKAALRQRRDFLESFYDRRRCKTCVDRRLDVLRLYASCLP